MEEKKFQNQEAVSGKKAYTSYLEEIKSEFKKVSWTSREELQVYTKVVVATTFLLGMVVYFTDIVIQTCLSSLNVALRVITG